MTNTLAFYSQVYFTVYVISPSKKLFTLVIQAPLPPLILAQKVDEDDEEHHQTFKKCDTRYMAVPIRDRLSLA